MQFTLTSLLALCVFTITSLASFGPMEGAVVIGGTVFLLVVIGSDTRTLAEGLVILCITAMLIGLLQPAVMSKGHDRGLPSCCVQMRNIAKALRAYHADHGCFPPACVRDKNGKAMHSWRVLILPYLGRDDLWQAYRMDEPWDGPNNRALARSTPEVYQCFRADAKPGVTTYVAIVGAETIWPEKGYARVSDIADGLEQTMIVGEASPDLMIPWTQPRDISFDDVTARTQTGPSKTVPPGLAAVHSRLPVATADGEVHRLPNDVSADTLRALLTVAGGEAVDLQRLTAPEPPPETGDWRKWPVSTKAATGLALLWAGSLLAMVVSVNRCRRERLAAARTTNPKTGGK